MRVINWWWSKSIVALNHTYFCDVNTRFPGIVLIDSRYTNRVWGYACRHCCSMRPCHPPVWDLL